MRAQDLLRRRPSPLEGVLLGNCIEHMRSMPAASVDAIVTDPPYGLGFMGKKWDSFSKGDLPMRRRPEMDAVNAGMSRQGGRQRACDDYQIRQARDMRVFQEYMQEVFEEALRVAKPGAHMLVFGGTRTFHRLACAIEDAGWEVRDTLMWVYGSGFPKSLDVSKAIDKAAGVEREVVGPGKRHNSRPFGEGAGDADFGTFSGGVPYETSPATDTARQWSGWGTALKPAYEPIILARKPLAGTVVANMLAHGTGAINVDGCRIQTKDNLCGGAYSGGTRNAVVGDDRTASGAGMYGKEGRLQSDQFAPPSGRWPANFLLGHSPECEQIGSRIIKTNTHYPASRPAGSERLVGHIGQEGLTEYSPVEEGVPAWSCAPGCPVALLDAQTGILKSGVPGVKRRGDEGPVFGQESRPPGTQMGGFGDSGGASRFFYSAKASRSERGEGNNHPTVKPLALMRWLCKLVTPPGGLVFDPFTGSGSTGVAALAEGFRFLGCEAEAEYVQIAQDRIRSVR